MARFRKKPVIIEAEQFRSGQGCTTIPFFSEDVCQYNKEIGWHIKTLEGDMHIADGDWVIRGIHGEYYPCKPDIFEKTYEPA